MQEYPLQSNKESGNGITKGHTKKKDIIKVLVEKYLTDEDEHGSTNQIDEDKQTIEDFYNSDDISTETAGRKATLLKHSDLPISKRFMIITIEEAYEIFKATYPKKLISRSKFYKCRPKHIVQSSKLPHNMCVCQYHANFSFLLEASNKIIKSIPSNFGHFLKKVCCDEANEVCMRNECDECVVEIVDSLVPLNEINRLEDSVEWKIWRMIDNRMVLSQRKGTAFDVLSELQMHLPKFKTHCYVKRVQQQYFQKRKMSIAKDEVVLQIDFAENYRLVNQNEIQSAHFSYSQVTIFTCVAWLHTGTKSFAITSNELAHNKYDVYCFLSLIIKKLKKKHPISKIFIFSDGCASQFKNKFIMSSLPHFRKEFNVSHFEWNFFATSHGKGAVDGIGAVLKRKVWQMVKCKNLILNNAHDFFKLARKNIPSIYILYVSSTYIRNTTSSLLERWAHVSSIPGIKSNYYFASYEENALLMAFTADSKIKKINL